MLRWVLRVPFISLVNPHATRNTALIWAKTLLKDYIQNLINLYVRFDIIADLIPLTLFNLEKAQRFVAPVIFR